MKIFIKFLLLTTLFLTLDASILHFKEYKLKGKQKGDTLLVFGGIHGNEPGGYFAPAILASHYKVNKGTLIVIPNLNFDSDIRFVRGLYGDMNRKFVKIKKRDPDFETVKEIKKIILSKKADLILNLHDGHGFYRKKWENVVFNPKAWGQALIIDQMKIDGPKYGNLDKICKNIVEKVNKSVFNNIHVFHVKNTKTRAKDEEMRKSLTYFAITHHQPALAIETSKNIHDTTTKVFYQLLAIEGFMQNMGIKYKRDFKLDKKHIKALLKEYGKVKINSRMMIDLTRARSFINHIPIKLKGNKFVFSHPLGAPIRKKRYFQLKVGNILVTTIKGDYFKLSNKKPTIEIISNGKKINATNIFKVKVDKSFIVKAPTNIRVNVIGFTLKNHKNEANIVIPVNKIDKRYSIYKDLGAYRIEFYDKKNRYIKTIIAEVKD